MIRDTAHAPGHQLSTMRSSENEVKVVSETWSVKNN